MYLVDEENGVVLVEEARRTSLLDDIPHFLHTACHSTKCEKRYIQLPGYDACQRSLPHSGRSPQDETADVAALHHSSEDGTGAHQVLLTDVTFKRQRTHSFC